MFCLYYDAKTKMVKGLNGSGRSPAGLDLAHLKNQSITRSIPFDNRSSQARRVQILSKLCSTAQSTPSPFLVLALAGSPLLNNMAPATSPWRSFWVGLAHSRLNCKTNRGALRKHQQLRLVKKGMFNS